MMKCPKCNRSGEVVNRPDGTPYPNGTIWDHAKEIEGKLVKANARMAEMIHIDELRAKADAIGYKQEYWRDGPGAIKALLKLFPENAAVDTRRAEARIQQGG